MVEEREVEREVESQIQLRVRKRGAGIEYCLCRKLDICHFNEGDW
jgi:hypothetical protein